MELRRTSEPFPGFDQLYLLERGDIPGLEMTWHLDIEESLALLRGELDADLIRVGFSFRSATAPKFAWPGTISLPIVSEEVVAALRDTRCAGWRSVPASVAGPEGANLSGFSGLQFLGRCGPLDEGRAPLVQREFPGGVFPVRLGMFFDEESWDGSDFFMANDSSAHVFVTRRVVRALEPLALLGLELECLANIERTPYP